MRIGLIIPILLVALHSGRAEQDYYQKFLSLADVDNPKVHAIKSPLLVDTNNITSRVTNEVINLHKLMASSELSGIRLGMTMDEVISRWRKPSWIWSRCSFPYPSFSYSDVILGFRGNRLEGIKLYVRDCRSADASSMKPGVEQCVRHLGQPKRRMDSQRFCRLVYEASDTTLTLDFYDGEMDGVRLERAALNPELKK